MAANLSFHWNELLRFFSQELLLGRDYFDTFIDKQSAIQTSNLLYRSIDVRVAGGCKDVPRLGLVISSEQQPARTLRNAEHEQQEDQGWYGFGAEHPSPVKPQKLGQGVVGEKGDQDAEHQLELVQDDEAAAIPGRREKTSTPRFVVM